MVFSARKKYVNMGETRGKGTRWNFEMSEPIEVSGDVRVVFYINRFGVKVRFHHVECEATTLEKGGRTSEFERNILYLTKLLSSERKN